MRKEQQQILMLGLIIAIIAVLLLFEYGSRFLPGPQGVLVVPPTPTRLLLPQPQTDDKLYQRQDFTSLREVPDMPLKPMPTEGTNDPFDVIVNAPVAPK